MKKLLIQCCACLILLFLLCTLRPIPKATFENSATVRGQLLQILEAGGPADITFRLLDDEHFYYINRGAESGLDATALNEHLANEAITVYYTKYWSPIHSTHNNRHITRVEHDGAIIYDEIES